jgi:purine-binding chemotaxis protein CheW
MKPKSGKNSIDPGQLSSLESLIHSIDHRIDQLPSPYDVDGFAAFLESRSEEAKKLGRQYVRFDLNDTAFALPLKNALEIEYIPPVTPLFNVPHWISGICNLRGDIVSVIDLKLKFGLKQAGPDTVKKMILIQNKMISTAIKVDKVAGVRFTDDQGQKTGIKNEPFSRLVRRVFDSNGHPIYLLDADELIRSVAV